MIIPIGIAVIGVFLFLALYQTKRTYIIYFPFSFPSLSINPAYFVKERSVGVFAEHELYSLTYFVVLTSLSYLDFTRNFRG